MKLETKRPSPSLGGIVASIAVLLILVTAGGALLFLSLMGPPEVESQETYAEVPGGASFDHSELDTLLKGHVNGDGWVDYSSLADGSHALALYISSLADAPLDDMGRNEKLALLINAYNAFTLQLILDNWGDGGLSSIRDIPGPARWDDQRWALGGKLLSLNEIEHREIRLNFREPRIHFALVCAAFSCPPLRNEAYQADRLEEQLEDQARFVHSHDRWFRFSGEGPEVHLTKLYDWYGGDFEQVAGSVLEFAARYAPELKSTLEAGTPPKVRWLDYDWRLNSIDNAPQTD